MALTGAEGLVTTLKAYVEANIAAKLTALNTEYADSITLATPVITYLGVKSLQAIPNYPALYILSPSARFAGWTVSSGESKPEIAIGVIVTDMDSEILQKRLYRYGRALIELMLNGMGVGLGNWVLSTNEEWATDTLTAANTASTTSQYVGEVTLSLRAAKIETM